MEQERRGHESIRKSVGWHSGKCNKVQVGVCFHHRCLLALVRPTLATTPCRTAGRGTFAGSTRCSGLRLVHVAPNELSEVKTPPYLSRGGIDKQVACVS